VIPTPRLLALLLVGAALFAAASFSSLLTVPAVAFTAAVAGVAALDALRSPRPRALAVERAVEDRLSLGADNAVTLHVQNRARYDLPLLVRDEAPQDFRLLTVQDASGPASASLPAPVGRVDVQGLGTAALRYEVLPVRRGVYRFGDVTVRYPTGLGLLLRQHTYPLAREVKVYPNLREVKRYDLALRRGQLQEVGLRRTRRFGVGTEFERLRDYHPDDDYRRINWPATARRHRPVTIDYQIERAQNVLLMLDVGRLMSAPIGPLTKLDHAVNACLLTAYVCLARGDNVGLLAFADRVTRYLHPRGGKGQFHAMLDSLYNVAPQPTESDYHVAFAFAEQRQRRRALVIAFTEIVDADTSRALVAMLSRTATRHVAVCATMRDPVLDEMAALPPTGSTEVYRRAVALTLIERRRATLEVLHTRGVIPIDVPANRLTPEVINTYLDLKARGRV
jgi:uncharacterized protein (DUF58 family)